MIVAAARLSGGEWSGQQIAEFVGTGVLGEAKPIVEPYDPDVVRRGFGL